MIPTMVYVCFVAVVVITVYALHQAPALTLVDVRVSKAEDDDWNDRMNDEIARMKADAEKAELIDKIKKAHEAAEAARKQAAEAEAVEANRAADEAARAAAEVEAARHAAEAVKVEAERAAAEMHTDEAAMAAEAAETEIAKASKTSVLKSLSIRNRRVQAVKRADAKKALANFASMYEGRLRPRK